jgi:hypothetical protein
MSFIRMINKTIKAAPLLLLAAKIYFDSALKALLIPTDHIDGTYQTFAALTRIAKYEIIGRDFQSYLGIGPVISLVPMWLIKGQTVAGLVFSTYLTLSMVVVFQIYSTLKWTPPHSKLGFLPFWTTGIFLSLSFISTKDFRFLSQLLSLDLLNYIVEPGASLRTLRNFFPWLLAYLLIHILKKERNPKVIMLLGGIVSGGSTALWSNDVGLSSGALFILFLAFYSYSSYNLSTLHSIFLCVATALTASFFYFVLISLISGFHPLEVFRYNFFDVRGDQFWYFAPWDQSGKVLNAWDFIVVLSKEWAIAPLLFLCALTFFTVRNCRLNRLCIVYVGWSLFCAASIATVLGHRDNYFIAFRFWAILVVMAMVSTKIHVILQWFRSNFNHQIFAVIASIVLFVLVSDLRMSNDSLNQKKVSLSASKNFIYSDEMGGYLPRGFRRANTFRLPPEKTIVEEYTGLVKASTKYANLMRVDSVIHALGLERQRAQNVMAASPDFVISTNPEMLRLGMKSGSWLSWNISANWWFYRNLFMSYEYEWFTPNTIIWTKSTSLSWPIIECRISSGSIAFNLPESSVGLYEVSLVLSSKPKIKTNLLRVRNAINYGDRSGKGLLTLNPNETSFLFPVFVSSSNVFERTFDIKTLINDNESPHIQSCNARKVLMNNSNNTFIEYITSFHRK